MSNIFTSCLESFNPPEMEKSNGIKFFNLSSQWFVINKRFLARTGDKISEKFVFCPWNYEKC